jgi:hypothetical protein
LTLFQYIRYHLYVNFFLITASILVKIWLLGGNSYWNGFFIVQTCLIVLLMYINRTFLFLCKIIMVEQLHFCSIRIFISMKVNTCTTKKVGNNLGSKCIKLWILLWRITRYSAILCCSSKISLLSPLFFTTVIELLLLKYLWF